MAAADRTWIVLHRDLTGTVVVGDGTDLHVTMVLDAGTGLIVTVNMRDQAEQSLLSALRSGLSAQVEDLPPGPPTQVVCRPELVADISQMLSELLADPPTVTEGISVSAEDIFDDLLGHLHGRAQAHEPPQPPDWALLFAQAEAYADAHIWTRWSDVEPLVCEVTIDGRAGTYVVVVLGNAGEQHGLAAYPGTSMPEGLDTWTPGEPPPIPVGSLMLWLDPIDEVPPEFAAKAQRYGWPSDAALHPLCVGGGPDGPADLSRDDAQALTVVIAAAMAFDARRLRVAGTSDVTTGEVTLGDGNHGAYRIAMA